MSERDLGAAPARGVSVVLAGVGGQGIVLASRLLARAAMGRGLRVRTAETIGMAQRGGSVTSHVRVGDAARSPLVGPGRADALVALEPAEAARQLALLAPGGTLVTSDAPVVPVSAMTGGPAYDLPAIMSYLRASVAPDRLVVVDAAAVACELGGARALNVALLGAAVRSGALAPLTSDDLAEAVRATVPERFRGLDERALDVGAAAVA